MRAVVSTDFGAPPEVLEVPTPSPGDGEVRVRVHAASINGFDLAVANGYLKGMMEHRFPVVLGKDFAGVVDEIGPGVSGYTTGDRVFGVVIKPYLGDGSFGEYVTVPVSVGLAKLPASVSFTDGAALGLAGAAAAGAVDGAQLRPGQSVLIAGATGGVGAQAVQLAANAGADVIATAHTDEERDLVSSLGATQVIDYLKDVAAQVLVDHPQGVDAVIHLAGDPAALIPILHKGGRFVSTLLSSPDQGGADDVTVVPISADTSAATLKRLASNHADKHTRVPIQRVYKLDEAPAALADFTSGTLGKLVISLD